MSQLAGPFGRGSKVCAVAPPLQNDPTPAIESIPTGNMGPTLQILQCFWTEKPVP